MKNDLCGSYFNILELKGQTTLLLLAATLHLHPTGMNACVLCMVDVSCVTGGLYMSSFRRGCCARNRAKHGQTLSQCCKYHQPKLFHL